MREWVWDSATQYKQKTDAQYADDLQQFMRDGGDHFGEVIIDPSAASFKAELLQRGIFHFRACCYETIKLIVLWLEWPVSRSLLFGELGVEPRRLHLDDGLGCRTH